MIKRKLLQSVEAHLDEKEITLITGPRQAGKTTLMLMLKKNLEIKGRKTLMFSLDFEHDKHFFSSQDDFVRKIKLEAGTEAAVVFIDEIQRKENAGLFLKGIFDMQLPYKLVVSGSGSLELKEKIHESLAGRKRIFELSPLSFEEFIHFKTDYAYERNFSEFVSLEKEKIRALADEYMAFGGYPRVVLGKTFEEKQAIINEIYQSYLEKDIAYLLRVKKTEEFIHLVKIIAAQIGQLATIAELSRTIGIAQQTIKEYLWYLQKTFILHKLTPSFTNIRKETTKSPVFYFYDLGLRNHAISRFGMIPEANDRGFLFQNFVYLMLRERIGNRGNHLHFWRTKHGTEVDFVIEQGQTKIPLEVKCQRMKKAVVEKSLRSFIEQYSPKQAFVINLDLETTLRAGDTAVSFMPAEKLLDKKIYNFH